MEDFLEQVNIFFSGPLMVGLLLTVGILLTVKLRFVQFTQFPAMLKNTLGGILYPPKRQKGQISPFQSAMTALSGTIGTGNIVGVATALAVGGAGAIFWMWVSAFFGMATKYAEILLSMRYRTQNADGSYSGGPMYYMEKGLGKKWVATLFAASCALASFGIGSMVQMNSVKCALTTLTDSSAVLLLIALTLTLLIAAALLGGIGRIAKVTSLLTPIAALLYLAGCVIVLAVEVRQIPQVLCQIFSGAFGLDAVGGGVGGYLLARAMRIGVARGIFTNEAGLGSAPIVYAASSEKNAHKQALWGIFEVFFDTLVMCTFTALVILVSGALPTGLDGSALTIEAFRRYFGDASAWFITLSLTLFAVSTVLSWSYYGQVCVNYLFGANWIRKLYKICCILAVYLGFVISLQLVWQLSDLLNSLMLLPNSITVLLLSLGVSARNPDANSCLSSTKMQ